jgi:hypothetical protein
MGVRNFETLVCFLHTPDSALKMSPHDNQLSTAHFNRVAVDVAALAPGDRNLFCGLHARALRLLDAKQNTNAT